MRSSEGLPGGHWHLSANAVLLRHLLSPNGLDPRALGGNDLARAGLRCRSLVLLAFGGKLVQKLLAKLGLQRRGVLMDLRLRAG
jgi:hypothetical protein